MKKILKAALLVGGTLIGGCESDQFMTGVPSSDVQTSNDVTSGQIAAEKCVSKDVKVNLVLDSMANTIQEIRDKFLAQGTEFKVFGIGCDNLDVPCSEAIVVTNDKEDVYSKTSLSVAEDGVVSASLCGNDNYARLTFQPNKNDNYGNCGYLFYAAGNGTCDEPKDVYESLNIEIDCGTEGGVFISDEVGDNVYEKFTSEDAKSMIGCMKEMVLSVFDGLKA